MGGIGRLIGQYLYPFFIAAPTLLIGLVALPSAIRARHGSAAAAGLAVLAILGMWGLALFGLVQDFAYAAGFYPPDLVASALPFVLKPAQGLVILLFLGAACLGRRP